jgi:hypothetical protein
VYLEKKIDVNAEYWLAMERYEIEFFSQHADQDDYDSSPRDQGEQVDKPQYSR